MTLNFQTKQIWKSYWSIFETIYVIDKGNFFNWKNYFKNHFA